MKRTLGILETLEQKEVTINPGTNTVKDVDRLFKVFQTLEKEHEFKALGNFMCCMSCASANIEDRCDKNEKYCVYFHGQDAETAHSNSTLHLRYGALYSSFPNETELSSEDKKAGKKVVQVLKQFGFDPEWNESPHTTIVLKKFRVSGKDNLRYGHDGDLDASTECSEEDTECSGSDEEEEECSSSDD